MKQGDLSVHLKTAVVGAAVAAAFALAGCGKKDEAIKIGHAGPLTGPVAHLGKDNENGVRLALYEANAAGIMIGGELANDPNANYGTPNGAKGAGAVDVYNNLIQSNIAGDDGGRAGGARPGSRLQNRNFSNICTRRA